MRIKIMNEPNLLRESVLLLDKSIDYQYEDIEIVKKEKVRESLSLEEREFFNNYKEYLENILRRVKLEVEIMDTYKEIERYFEIRFTENKTRFLLESIAHNKAESLDDLNLFNFKIASYGSLLTNNISLSDEETMDLEDEKIDDYLELQNLISVLNLIEIEIEHKYLILEFFSNIDSIFESFLKVLSKIQEIYKEEYHKVKPYVDRSVEKYETEDGYIDDFNKLYIAEFINVDEISSGKESIVYYYISTIVYNGISLAISDNNRFLNVGIEGVLVFYLTEIEEDKIKASERHKGQLNIIGDSTRLSIIELLSEREYYAKEIADELEISPSTVSHHIEILIQNELVKVKVQGRRAYYSINKKSMLELANLLKKYGGE